MLTRQCVNLPENHIYTIMNYTKTDLKVDSTHFVCGRAYLRSRIRWSDKGSLTLSRVKSQPSIGWFPTAK